MNESKANMTHQEVAAHLTGSPCSVLGLFLAALRYPVLRLPLAAPLWWRPVALVLVVTAQLGNLGDLVTTVAGLWLGAEEVGPGHRWLFGFGFSEVPTATGIRIFIAALLAGCWLAARVPWTTRLHRGIALVGMGALAGATAILWGVVIHNVRAILSLVVL